MEKTAPRVAIAVMVFLPLAFLGLFFLWPTLRIIGLGLSGTATGLGSGGSAGFGGALREMLGRTRTWTTLFLSLIHI